MRLLLIWLITYRLICSSTYLNIYDFIANKGLKEDTDKSHKSILHVPIFDSLTRWDTIGNVQMNKFWREIHRLKIQRTHKEIVYCFFISWFKISHYNLSH